MVKRYRKKTSNKPWYKKKYSAMELASKAVSGLKYVKGIINSEKHFKTTSATAALINHGSGNNVIDLTAIAQGDQYFNRNGNSLLAKSVFIRGYIRRASSTNNIVRIMVIMDKMNQSGTPPTYGAMFTGASSANAPIGNLRKDNGANIRYKILHTQMVVVDAGAKSLVPFKKFIDLGNTHIKYTGTLGSDQFKNQIYLVYVSDVNTNDPTIDYIVDVAYYDN